MSYLETLLYFTFIYIYILLLYLKKYNIEKNNILRAKIKWIF